MEIVWINVIVLLLLLAYVLDRKFDKQYVDSINNEKLAKKAAIEDMADEFNMNCLSYDKYFKELSL